MTKIVIMAGGRGLRLHPLTEHTPKPMLTYNSKPMLQEMIEDFRDQGFTDFTLSVNYLSHIIKEHFGDGSKFGVNIDYVEETEPLGTAGSLRLMEIPDEPFIVINADIICKVDYKQLILFHKGWKANTMVVCSTNYQHQIPFGIIQVGAGRDWCEIEEKPVRNYQIVAGIYVFPPSIFREFPEGYLDMNDLITKALIDHDICLYPLENHWQDVGTLEVFNGGK